MDKKVKIIFEDNHLLVVDKPENIPVQEDISGDPDLLTLLKNDLKKRYGKPGNVYLGLIHRLDRPVGGVMVFAKTSKAASRLSDMLRKKEFTKGYLAVVHGVFEKKSGKLEHYLLKDREKNIVSSVPASQKGGKHAILEYRVIGTKENLSLVYVNLLTGRSHQIRVQMSESGHPIFGDQKYGKGKNSPGKQIALHSYRLEFIHPVQKKHLIYHSVPIKSYPWNLFNINPNITN